MNMKEFGYMITAWFSRKNLLQKTTWIVYLVALIYEFFATPTSFELFGFIFISLPVILILDYFFGKLINH